MVLMEAGERWDRVWSTCQKNGGAGIGGDGTGQLPRGEVVKRSCPTRKCMSTKM